MDSLSCQSISTNNEKGRREHQGNYWASKQVKRYTYMQSYEQYWSSILWRTRLLDSCLFDQVQNQMKRLSCNIKKYVFALDLVILYIH